MASHSVANSIYDTNERTDGRRDASVLPSVRQSVGPFFHSFVSLSVVSVRDVHPIGERTAMLHVHVNLRKWIKIRDQPIYTKFGQLIIRKIIKIIATICHILKLKCTKFFSRRRSVRSLVSKSIQKRDGRSDKDSCLLFVRLLDGAWHSGRGFDYHKQNCRVTRESHHIHLYPATKQYYCVASTAEKWTEHAHIVTPAHSRI